MARYIDADKLCDSLRESYNRLFELYKKAKDNDAATICEAELNTFMECVIRAKTQPTADVVEIPCRCERCKYTEIFTCPITGTETLFCIYGTQPVAVEPTHYCGYGERKQKNDF